MVQTVITILKTKEKHYIEDLVEIECLNTNITYRTKNPITNQLGFFKPNEFIIVKDVAESTSTTYNYVAGKISPQCPSGQNQYTPHTLYECINYNVGRGLSSEEAEVYCNSRCVQNCSTLTYLSKCDTDNSNTCMRSRDSSNRVCFWSRQDNRCEPMKKICGCRNNKDCSTNEHPNEHCAYNMCQTNKLGSLCDSSMDCSSNVCVEQGIKNDQVYGVFKICQTGGIDSGCNSDKDCKTIPPGLTKGVCADRLCRDGSYNSPCNTSKDCLSNICVNNPDAYDDISLCKLGQLNDICKSGTDCSGHDLSCQKWGSNIVGTCQKSFFNYDQKIFCNNLSDCPKNPGGNQPFPALACKARLDQSATHEKVCWYGLPNSICSVNNPTPKTANSSLCRLTMVPGDHSQPQGHCVPGVSGQYGHCSLGTIGDPCWGSNMCSPVPNLKKNVGVCAGYKNFSGKHGVCSNGNINAFCISNNDCLWQEGQSSTSRTGICALNPSTIGYKHLQGRKTCQNPNRNGMACTNQQDCIDANQSGYNCTGSSSLSANICSKPCPPPSPSSLQPLGAAIPCTTRVSGRGEGPISTIIKDSSYPKNGNPSAWLSRGPHIFGWIKDSYCSKSILKGGGRCGKDTISLNSCYLYCDQRESGIDSWDEFVKECIWDKDHAAASIAGGGPFGECMIGDPY